MENEQKCQYIHKWDGNVPVVDGTKHEVQFPHLVNRPCDCGRMIWVGESLCGCTDKRWEAVVNPNPNYIPS